MATAAIAAQGSLFDVEIATVFTNIPEVIRGSTPGYNNETIDVTNHNSVGGAREKIATYRNSENVTYEGNYIPGNTVLEAVEAAAAAGTVLTFRTTPPGVGSRLVTFDAIPSFVVNLNTGEQARYTITLEVSGLPVWSDPV